MGKFLKRGLSCPVCGGSDPMAKYLDEKTGKEYGICFSGNCPTNGKAQFDTKADWSDMEDDTFEKEPMDIVERATTIVNQAWQDEYRDAVSASPVRMLSLGSFDTYGVKQTKDHLLFPYFAKDALVGIKRRGRKEKTFDVKGIVNKTMLFGQQAFNAGGKFITVHSGEFDAMAGYTMFGNKYANVSIPTGDGSALECCKANFDYLNSFETIRFSFDADESGQKNIAACCALFGKKATIVKMDAVLKDANGYLEAGKTQEWTQAWWNAQPWTPDGIVAGDSLWDRINKPQAKPMIPWPWHGMNDKLYGIYPRRLYCWTAGSGVGKTQLIREATYHVLMNSDINIGILMLEESVEDSAVGFMSLHINKPLHVPTTVYTPEEYKAAYDATHKWKNNRVFYHDHFGSTEISNILDRVTYLIRVMDCKLIILDHLSIIVSAQLQGDERKAIDEIMTKLRMLVQETGATIFMVSHLSRRQGKDYTEGAQVSTSDLRGSASIEQLSDCIIAAERNGQHKDPIIANTTNIRIIKSRQFGKLGLATALFYDSMTGRMTEVDLVDTTDTTEGEPF